MKAWAIFALLALGSLAAAAPAGDELRLVVIVTRHGICSPGSNAMFAEFAAKAWPEWSEPVGQLTDHGRRQMAEMGKYYRERYIQEGLLTGRPLEDLRYIRIQADSDQRTLETARQLAAALLPGLRPAVHARIENEPDPLFRPNLIPVGHADRALAEAALLGRLSNSPDGMAQAHAAAFTALERILQGDGGEALDRKKPLSAVPTSVVPGSGGHVVELEGPLRLGMIFAETFSMQYLEGWPLAKVGWGRVDGKILRQVLELDSLYQDITQRTFYPAQVQASNLASHILQTLKQAAEGESLPGALGSVSDRMVVLVGHDTNLANLGGLLGVSWLLPDGRLDPTPPGGALVFELRQARGDRQFSIRMFFISQTLEQIRTLQPLSLDEPPMITPIFVPGCSTALPKYDAPFSAFANRLRSAIRPEFVAP